MAQFDPVKRLQEAGIAFDQLPQDQHEAVTSLSPEEVDTLIRVQERLSGAAHGTIVADAGDTGVLIF